MKRTIRVMALLLALAAVHMSADDAAIPLDARKRLFLDDYLIASSTNVTRRIHPARKHPANPVVRGTQLYEHNYPLLYGSVLQDEGRYRMWYLSPAGVHYAESADGIRWTKPEFDVVRRDGRKTNIVVGREDDPEGGAILPFFHEIFGVYRDERDADAGRRYKMAFLSIDRKYQGPREDPFHKGQRRGVGIAASADGIHWRVIDNWATEAVCDGGSHIMWDPALRKYVLYGRTKFIPSDVADAWGLHGAPSPGLSTARHAWIEQYFWGRSVARVEGHDFLDWDQKDPATAPVVMSTDLRDPPGSEIYDLLVFPYESVYIGLVRMFYNRPEGSTLDIQLAVSQDGRKFTRVGDRSAFISVGEVGDWDRFNNSLSSNPPIAAGDELRFYYSGRSARHAPYRGADSRSAAGIGLATIPRDRFVSLAAGFEGGVVTTKPLRIVGRTLHLNAKADFGDLVVEVLDEKGKPIVRSKPMTADTLDFPVEWEAADWQIPAGPVTLRFILKNALLYAVWAV